jgi:hypothetical protein
VSLSVVTPFFPPRNGSDLHAILQLVGCWDQLPKIPRSSHYLPIFSRKSPYFYIFFLTPAEGEIPSRSAKEKVAAEFENHGEVSVEQSKYLGGRRPSVELSTLDELLNHGLMGKSAINGINTVNECQPWIFLNHGWLIGEVTTPIVILSNT